MTTTPTDTTTPPRAHLEWEVCQMLNHVKPADLTDAELQALIAVLWAPHVRVITPPTGDGPIYRIKPHAVDLDAVAGQR